MDSTIRNLDEKAYRAFRARAVRENKTMGEMVSEAMLAYLGRPLGGAATTSLLDLKPVAYGPGTEHLSASPIRQLLVRPGCLRLQLSRPSIGASLRW